MNVDRISITRTPDALAIVSCEIALSGGDLSEGRCYRTRPDLVGGRF